MNKRALTLLLAIISTISAFCQDSIYAADYGRLNAADFHPASAVIDSNSDVVVLKDVGHATLISMPLLGWRVVYMRYRRMLIRNAKGVEAAKVDIRYNPHMNGDGILPSLHAHTCNLKNGKIVTSTITAEDVYLTDEKDGDVTERFAFADVGAGSILEYTYEIFTANITLFQPWDFQGEYPRLSSEFTATIPAIFNYVVSTQGEVNATKKVDTVLRTMQAGSYTIKTPVYSVHYGMRDVPALQSEPYVAAMSEHVAGLRFQLSAYTELDTRRRKMFLNSWKDLNERFYKNNAFGGIMTASTHFLRKELREIVEDSLSEMDKARKLYAYVRDNFTTKGSELLSENDRTIKEIFKSRRGNIPEINLLLTAMLRDEGLKADAVILSTKGNGVINPYYPMVNNLNYVIVRLRLAGQEYFLDATDKHLGFGRIPLACYNGYARIVSERPDSAILSPDSVVENRYGLAILSSNESGDALTGAFKETEGYYSSLKLRDSLSRVGDDAFFERVRKRYPAEMRLSEWRVDSLKTYEEPVTVHYTLSIPIAGEDRIYFNPMLSGARIENPFVSAVRRYPVEMPFRAEELFVLQMDIPKGYEVEELPKSLRVRLNESDGSYEYGFYQDGETLQFRSRLVLKRTYFLPEEYQNLRDFYAMVVKKQGEVVVFRKKK